MSNTLYFIRGQKTDAALEQLIQNYGLEKSYESRRETIFRGDEMLVTLAKRYLFFYIYDECNVSLKSAIRKVMYY